MDQSVYPEHAGLQLGDICFGIYRGAPTVELASMPTTVSCADYDREHGTRYDSDSAKAWSSGPLATSSSRQL
jgi:hypothetical protein